MSVRGLHVLGYGVVFYPIFGHPHGTRKVEAGQQMIKTGHALAIYMGRDWPGCHTLPYVAPPSERRNASGVVPTTRLKNFTKLVSSENPRS